MNEGRRLPVPSRLATPSVTPWLRDACFGRGSIGFSEELPKALPEGSSTKRDLPASRLQQKSLISFMKGTQVCRAAGVFAHAHCHPAGTATHHATFDAAQVTTMPAPANTIFEAVKGHCQPECKRHDQVTFSSCEDRSQTL